MEKESSKTKKDRMADRRARLRVQGFPFAMMTPFLIITSIFVVVPIIIMFILSFTDFNFSMKGSFIGLRNYRQIFGYPGMGQILLQTFLFVGVSVVFSVLGSIFIVIITTFYLDIIYKRKKLGLLFRVLWLVPDLTPTIVYMFMWKFVFGAENYGLINKFLSFFGLPSVAWFTDHAMFLLLFTTILKAASGSVILFSSAVSQIPENVIQSAKVDGASSLTICFKIVLSYLRWPIMQKTLWTILGSFCTYESIKLLTDGGPMAKTTTYAYYIYQNAYDFQEYGYGAALSVFMVIMSTALGMLMLRIFKIDKQMQDPRMDI